MGVSVVVVYSERERLERRLSPSPQKAAFCQTNPFPDYPVRRFVFVQTASDGPGLRGSIWAAVCSLPIIGRRLGNADRGWMTCFPIDENIRPDALHAPDESSDA